MKPIDGTGRALLDAANRERTPDAATRARVLAGVLAVGASAAAGSAKAASGTLGAASVKAGAGLVHWLALAALGVAGALGAYFLLAGGAGRQAQVSASVSAPAAVVPSAPPVASALATAEPSMPASSVVLPASNAGASSASMPASAASAGNGLDREISLLQSAHAAYRAGQAGKALQLAREHGRAFPHSQLAAERQSIEVLSLCALGRVPEARAIAGRLRAASGSPSLAGLSDSCVGK